MKIEFVEIETENKATTYEAFMNGIKVGELLIEKDFEPDDGTIILRDTERKFRLGDIHRTPEGEKLIEHHVLYEEFYKYMKDQGYGMAVQIYYYGEAEGKETNGLGLYDYYDRYWDRYEVYALKL